MKKRVGIVSLLLLFACSGVLFAGKAKVPADQWVYIQIVDQKGTGNGFWTVGGEDKNAGKGSILKLRKFNVNPKSQKFKLVSAGRGLYYLESKRGGYLEIVNYDKNIGSEIRLWKKDKKNKAQKFKVQHLKNGRYVIIANNNRVVCPADIAPKNKKFVRALDKPRDSRYKWIIIMVDSEKMYNPDYKKPNSKPKPKPESKSKPPKKLM